MKTIVVLLFIFIAQAVIGQELIGKSESEVYAYLLGKGIKQENMETGKRLEDHTKWLSYSNGNIKNMYFFDTSSKCIYLRKIYPNSYLTTIRLSLKDSLHTPLSDSTWLYRTKNNNYIIYLVTDEKYFILDQSPEKKPK
jgi:hypothetical protein